MQLRRARAQPASAALTRANGDRRSDPYCIPHVHVPKQRSGESYADNTCSSPAAAPRSHCALVSHATSAHPATCDSHAWVQPQRTLDAGRGRRAGERRQVRRSSLSRCTAPIVRQVLEEQIGFSGQRARCVSGLLALSVAAPRSYAYTETFARGLEERVHSVHFWHGTLRSDGATTSYSCIPEAKFPKAPPRHAAPPSRVSGLEQNGKSTLPHGLRSLSRLHGFSASRATSSSPRRSLKCAL